MSLTPPDPRADAEIKALMASQNALRRQYEQLLENEAQALKSALGERDALLKANQKLLDQLQEQTDLITCLKKENQQLEEAFRRAAAGQNKPVGSGAVGPAPVISKPLPKPETRSTAPRVEFADLVGDLAKPGSGTISASLRKTVVAMHRSMPQFARHIREPEALAELIQQIKLVHHESIRAGILPIHQVVTALKILFEDYSATPSLMVASSLRTVGQVMDLLLRLVDKTALKTLQSLPPPNVLAVDDDIDVLEILKCNLGSLGIHLVGINDSKEAIPILESQSFDLVLLDIGMADHNGFEICSRIRHLEGYRRTPVVFLTGMNTVELRDQALLVGGNDFLDKPFHAAALGLKCVYWAIKSRV